MLGICIDPVLGITIAGDIAVFERFRQSGAPAHLSELAESISQSSVEPTTVIIPTHSHISPCESTTDASLSDGLRHR